MHRRTYSVKVTKQANLQSRSVSQRVRFASPKKEPPPVWLYLSMSHYITQTRDLAMQPVKVCLIDRENA
jgi:hypothetical protein